MKLVATLTLVLLLSTQFTVNAKEVQQAPDPTKGNVGFGLGALIGGLLAGPPGAIIGANVKIGKNCIINTKTVVEHGSIISDNSHLATSVTINSGTKIGANSFIGSNSTLAQEVTIKNNSFIKMCSRITK